MNLSGRIHLSLELTATKADGLTTATDPLREYLSRTLSSGAGANAANGLYHEEWSVAAEDTEQIDFTALTDRFGDALNFARLKYLYILNTGTVPLYLTSTLVLLGAPVSAVPIRAGEFYIKGLQDATGYVVQNGISDTIIVENLDPATAGTFDIVAVGATS